MTATLFKQTFHFIYIHRVIINGFIKLHSFRIRHSLKGISDQSDPSKVIEKSHINKINLLNLFFLPFSSFLIDHNMHKQRRTLTTQKKHKIISLPEIRDHNIV